MSEDVHVAPREPEGREPPFQQDDDGDEDVHDGDSTREPEGREPPFREDDDDEPAAEDQPAPDTVSPAELQAYYARVEANPTDLEAWYYIGSCPWYGEGGVEQDREEGERIWRAALHNYGNDDDVHDNTGKIRYTLNPYDQLSGPRLEWESAQGDSRSQLFLGCCFEIGEGGLEPDHNQAAHWWDRSAEQGNVHACCNIGRCYWSGHGVERDLVKAVEWFDKAIARGFTDAWTYKHNLLGSLEFCFVTRNRVLGCVQRNRWLNSVRRSVELKPPLGIWAIALVHLFESENKWASLSPAFICLKQVAPALSTMGMKRKRV